MPRINNLYVTIQNYGAIYSLKTSVSNHCFIIFFRYVWIGNFTGVPCLTVPIGYDKQGLPIGLQIMGRWWDDHLVLRIGNVLEGFIKNKYKRPQVYYENLKK